MSFDYDKLHDKVEEVNWWTSFSDLWSMLSVVFLLMFVCASLRSGAQGIQQLIENKDLGKKNSELQEQLRVYNSLREESLQQAGQQEQEVYQKLMSKLSLLQEDAKDEKEALRKKAKENEDKEFALNQYQQVVRNIINANLLSKSQLARRDQSIIEKKQTIAEKQAEIAELDRTVHQREATINANEAKIGEINNKLAGQINKLRLEEKRAKLSKVAMNKAIAKLKQEGEQKVAALVDANEQARNQLEGELQQTKEHYAGQLAALRAENAGKLAAEKAAFEASLNQQRLGAAARAAKLAAYQQQAEGRARELEGQLGGLMGKMKDAEGALASARAEQGRLAAEAAGLAKEKAYLGAQVGGLAGKVKAAQGQLAEARDAQGKLEERARNLAQEKQALGGELQKAQDRLNAKKNLISQIQKNFAKSGISAKVDQSTGDVVVDFGEDYFDTGSSQLKGGMVARLNRLIPEYSKSLFQDPKTAEKIANIEIIGLASSTFNGRYVNPRSLKPENQNAINYNLKLSFSRAKAIFEHIFNPSKLSYENQKRLLPLVKVVGRGFLPEGLNEKDLPEDMSEKVFCEKYNCKKAQRVIVKFNLKE